MYRPNKRRGLVATLLALFAVLSSLPAAAQLRFTVIGGEETALPVAIVPFGWLEEGDAPLDIAGVIDADLARSGQFAPIARNRMLGYPTTGSEVDYADWTQFQVEIVTVGRVERVQGDNYRVTFQVMDVPRRQQLLGYTLTSLM